MPRSKKVTALNQRILQQVLSSKQTIKCIQHQTTVQIQGLMDKINAEIL